MIIPLSSDLARDIGQAGGKAASLAKLLAADFPVPGGIVVPCREFAPVVADLGLHDSIRDLLDPRAIPDAEVDSRAAAVSKRIQDADFPVFLAREISEGLAALEPSTSVRFAVRSSARAEDLDSATFAGQYGTFLNVERSEVNDAILRCWASFLSARSIHYRRARGLHSFEGAVLVQTMVQAQCAGVAFTINPRDGDDGVVVINAAPGLGDALVSGLVTPDEFMVEKEHGQVRRGPSNPTSGLSEAMLQAISALAQRVETVQGAPVDIEWAVRDKTVHLLQARAVTALNAPPPSNWIPEINTRIDPRFPIYSNGNVGEIVPGCLTPLSWSLMSDSLEDAFRGTQEALGTIGDVGRGPIVLGYFFHRLYLNVSYFVAATDNSPGSDRRTAIEEVLGPGEDPGFPPPPPAWRNLLPWRVARGVAILARLIRMQADMDRLRAEAAEIVQQLVAAAKAEPGVSRSPEWLQRAPSDRDRIPARAHVRTSMFAQLQVAHLRRLTKRWLDDQNGALARALVTGLGPLEGSAPAEAIGSLATLARTAPGLSDEFAVEPDNLRLLQRLRGGLAESARTFVRRFDDMLERFGHRGFAEAELRNPRWREEPAQLIALIRSAAGSEDTRANEAARERQREASQEARASALKRLSGLKKKSLLTALDNARGSVAARERTKDLVAKALEASRSRFLAVARVLVAGGALDREDDVFFLLRDEVAALSRNDLSAPEARRIVARRRREFAWSEGVVVPRVQKGTPRFLTERPAVPGGDHLRGIGVSAGRATGRARIVLDPRAPVTIGKGEILVLPVTDLAWTPLFLNAGGLVVEVGGLLSHGAIVAREYGLPAVVAVPGATELIREGDLVTVDGGEGVIVVAR